LQEAAQEFEVETNFESNTNVKDLEGQIAALKTINSNLETISKKYDQMTTCCICEEKYESTGERAPVKLKCSHIICEFCANSWLTQKVKYCQLETMFKLLFLGKQGLLPDVPRNLSS
jgi:N-methylhydantoinase B/oxoprolinase/acetone carboxylase alpha subunit